MHVDEMTLQQRRENLNRFVNPLPRKTWAKGHKEAQLVLRRLPKEVKKLKSWARPINYLANDLFKEVHAASAALNVSEHRRVNREHQVCTAIITACHKLDVPMFGDVVQNRHGPAHIVLEHYDFGATLSMYEQLWVDQLVRVTAGAISEEIHTTVWPLRYSLAP